ncbi:hypothetical protein BT93_E0936 [Corymbia citriodora subsp. variegata]|nr:hypothetical protein BT93_E0936 [Corymbia citriodora subsp. variegata]
MMIQAVDMKGEKQVGGRIGLRCRQRKKSYLGKSNEKGNEQAGEVIKNALAKVLVDYYPLAGRLVISPTGRLMVDCNREGAVFVVAEANCMLSELGDMTKPNPERLGGWSMTFLVQIEYLRCLLSCLR